MGINADIKKTINKLKESDIYGCITGSCLLNEDFEHWDSKPDVDVFVYSRGALMNAIDILRYKYGFIPGTNKPNSNKGELWKIDRIIRYDERKNNYKYGLCTIKLVDPKTDIVVNITHKPSCESVQDVVNRFDMSIIMRGYDIKKKLDYDQRRIQSKDVRVAYPNPFRNQDYDRNEVPYWVRQFDRVIKYWDRGFDTRPMARFYVDLIDGVIDNGVTFVESEKDRELYQQFVDSYTPIRDKIQMWLDDKEGKPCLL